MQCPKDKKVELVDATLLDSLAVNCCPSCQGTWIPAGNYETWQAQHSQLDVPPNLFTQEQSSDFIPSAFDAKAGLCPECGSYLTRVKVNLKTPFYLERCSSCNGIWCDRGEWEVLQHANLHTQIQQLFAPKWQIQMREVQHHQQERQILIDKLGADLAADLFALADALENHNHGDFALAYIMRRFDRGEKDKKAI